MVIVVSVATLMYVYLAVEAHTSQSTVIIRIVQEQPKCKWHIDISTGNQSLSKLR